MNDRELALSLLLLDDQAGPAQPITSTELDAAVENALRQAAVTTSPTSQAPTIPTHVWAPLALLSAAAISWLLWPSAPAITPPVAAPTPIEIVAPTAALEAPSTPEVVEEIAPIAPVIAPATVTARRVESTSPDDLLARANTLRIAHRWREASETYDEVMARAPSSRSAYVARLSAASIALDQLHAPRRALALYHAAAEADLDLDPQAEHGLSRALRALDDTDGERAVLTRLLAAHPTSPLSGPARQRLAELNALETP